MRTRVKSLMAFAMAGAIMCLSAVLTADPASERIAQVSTESLDAASTNLAPSTLVAPDLAYERTAQAGLLAASADSRHRDRMWAMPAPVAPRVSEQVAPTTVHDLPLADLRPRPGWRYSI